MKHFSEKDFHGSEPSMAPVSDFVIENIDDLSRLNDSNEHMADWKFQKILKEILQSIVTFESKQQETCSYYTVHKKVTINGKEVGFVVKVMHPDVEDLADKVIDEYETLENYCPDATLPTIFLTTNIGPSRIAKIAIQREINGLTLQQYVDQYGDLTDEIRKQLGDVVGGLRALCIKEHRAIDSKTTNPGRDNILVDPAVNKLWIVDTNHLDEPDEISYLASLDQLENFANKIRQI